MNIFDPNVTGLWVDLGCLLLIVGVIIWDVIDYFRRRGEPEDDSVQTTMVRGLALAVLRKVLGKVRAYSGGLKVVSGDDGKKLESKDAEIKRLKEQLAGSSAGKEEAAAKDLEIKQLNARLTDMLNRQEVSEKKLTHLKKSESDAGRYEAEIEKHKKRAGELLDEMNMMKAREDGAAGKLAEKDVEIKLLKERLAESASEKESLAENTVEKDAEIKRLKEQLAGSLSGKEDLAAKDAEIKRLSAQLTDMQGKHEASEKKLTQFKKIEADIQWLEGETDERRKYSHDIKRRIEESRMKMRLLSEKTKENVELLAGFVEGKEFDEFRKSIHLDELIQKYEDEIKELRIKNMDLEKRAR